MQSLTASIFEVGGLVGAMLLIGGSVFYTVAATLVRDPLMVSRWDDAIQIMSIGAMFAGAALLLVAVLALIVLGGLTGDPVIEFLTKNKT